MKTEDRIAQLEKQNEEMAKIINDQNVEILSLQKLNAMLIKIAKADQQKAEDMLSSLKKSFQSSTEQLMLFNETENTVALGALEETPQDNPVDVKSYTRKKARSGITLPADTPVVDVYDDCKISTCSRCGSPMKEAGEKIYETFTKISYTAIIRKHVKQFTCTQCTPEDGEVY